MLNKTPRKPQKTKGYLRKNNYFKLFSSFYDEGLDLLLICGSPERVTPFPVSNYKVHGSLLGIQKYEI